MILNISKEDCIKCLHADRDSVANDYGSQGFEIFVGCLGLHFEDERDVIRLAQQILTREGLLCPAPQSQSHHHIGPNHAPAGAATHNADRPAQT